MADTWITDARHAMGPELESRRLPGPAVNMALFLRSIVEWMSSRPVSGEEPTNVFCRRRPDRRRCGGRIVASIRQGSEDILWRCSRCGDNGLIHDWAGSDWDRRRP